MRSVLTKFLSFFLLINTVLAQNILNNGGFEYGLMCDTTIVWSYSGDWTKGDYKFRLSTDSHSETYSLQIGCEGPDCFKAAVLTNKIPTQPNQAYKFKVYSKCSSTDGTLSAIYVPDTAGGDTFKPVACTGDWAPNVINFTTGPTSTDFFMYFFNYYGTPGTWVRYDDAVLTYADGTAPQEVILHAGVRDVRISGGTVLVDGHPHLDLGFFDVRYNDLAQVAALGANSIHAILYQPAANCFNAQQKSYLDQVYDLGMNFVPSSSTTAELATPGPFPAAVKRFAPHLANIAWFLADEPDQSSIAWWYVPPAAFIAEYQAIKTATNLPVFADFQRAAWSVQSDVAPYTAGVDFWMAEPYGGYFPSLTYAMNMFNTLQPRPVWLAQDGSASNLIVPKAYFAVTSGATGIVYFDWDTFKGDPKQLSGAQQVFTELTQLTNVIFGVPMDTLVTPPSGISSMARHNAGKSYILSVNSNPSNITGKFLIQGLTPGQQVNVLFENRSITADTGSFTDTFTGIARHVYVIDALATAPSDPAPLPDPPAVSDPTAPSDPTTDDPAVNPTGRVPTRVFRKRPGF